MDHVILAAEKETLAHYIVEQQDGYKNPVLLICFPNAKKHKYSLFHLKFSVMFYVKNFYVQLWEDQRDMAAIDTKSHTQQFLMASLDVLMNFKYSGLGGVLFNRVI